MQCCMSYILLLIGSYLLGSSHVFLTELRLLIFEYLRAVAADVIAFERYTSLLLKTSRLRQSGQHVSRSPCSINSMLINVISLLYLFRTKISTPPMGIFVSQWIGSVKNQANILPNYTLCCDCYSTLIEK